MKRVSSFILVICMVLSIIPTLAVQVNAADTSAWNGVIPAANPNTNFSGGTGTKYAPFLLSSANDLAQFAANLNAPDTDTRLQYYDKYYRLTCNVNLNNYSWTPISDGTESTPFHGGTAFCGEFDGSGNTISGLKVTGSDNSTVFYVGLFGIISGGTIKNLNIVDSSISCDGYTVYSGGIAGLMSSNSEIIGCVVDNCSISANATAYGYAGGIVGGTNSSNGSTTIKYCYANSDISTPTSPSSGASMYSGGIVGATSGSSNFTYITYCYSEGTVRGQIAGGIAGLMNGACTLSNIGAKHTSITGTSSPGRIASSLVTASFNIPRENVISWENTLVNSAKVSGNDNQTANHGESVSTVEIDQFSQLLREYIESVNDTPYIKNITPANNSTGIETLPTISITFDRNMYGDYSGVKLVEADTNQEVARTITAVGLNKIQITPKEPLKENTKYRLIIPALSIYDAAKSKDICLYFAGLSDYSFTTLSSSVWNNAETIDLSQYLGAENIVSGYETVYKSKLFTGSANDVGKATFVASLTNRSLQYADPISREVINTQLYNLLFNATYRPQLFGGDTAKIQSWPMQNCHYLKVYLTSENDEGLGMDVDWGTPVWGCYSYALFATAYTYESMSKKDGFKPANWEEIRTQFRSYLDPGETIRYEQYKGYAHALVFLGESEDENGFYFISYGGGYNDEDYYDDIVVGYFSYSDFYNVIKKYNMTIYLWDSNNGSYYYQGNNTTAVNNNKYTGRGIINVSCPIEVIISLEGYDEYTLDSRIITTDGDVITAPFGTMTASGIGDHRSVEIELYQVDTYRYDITIIGTGEGSMDITFTYEYTEGDDLDVKEDIRTFIDVPITLDTTITTYGLSVRSTTALYVNDGSGDDLSIWQANENETVYSATEGYSLYSPNNFNPEDTAHTITATAGEGGSISPSGYISVTEGEDQSFTITADSGYEISDVLVDNESVGLVSFYTFEDVDDDHTIEARFTQIIKDISFTATQTGGTSGMDDSTGIILAFSEAVTGLKANDITISDSTGAAVKGTLSGSGTTWTIALDSVTTEGNVNVSVSDFGTFHVTSNSQAVAVYKNTPPTTHTVTFSVTGGNGTLTASLDSSGISSGTSVQDGKTVEFTATPNLGYRVKEWKDNSNTVNGTNLNYTISSIASTHSITVEFEAIPSTVTDVAVNPSTKTLTPGDTFQFSATVNGTNTPPQTVTWSLSGGNGMSTIEQDGTSNVDDGESNGTTLTVTAASTLAGYTDVSGTATVTISATAPTPTVTGVTVTPGDVTLNKGDTQSFSVIVNGDNGPSQAVTWTVEDGNGTTAITSGGTLTISADETAATLTIRATSDAEPIISGTATVTVYQLPVFVPVTNITDVPTIATAGTGLALSSTVIPSDATNQTIVWSVKEVGTTGATITGNTLNTATAGTVIVTATIANGTATGNYTQDFSITVNASTVSVTSITVTGAGNATTITTNGGTLQMSATVLPVNASNKAVTWSVENGTGSATISAAGLLTAIGNGTVTVKATANDGSGIVGTLVVTISGQSSGNGSGSNGNSGSGNNGNTTVSDPAKTASVDLNGQTVKATLNADGSLTLIYTESDIRKYSDNTGEFCITISGQNSVTFNIDIHALEGNNLVIHTDFGIITIPNATLQKIKSLYGDTLRLVITKGSFRLYLLDASNKEVAYNDPSHPFIITLPYTLTSGQKPGEVVAVDENGTVFPLGIYADGTVEFEIAATGTYDVKYNAKAFSDITGHWAADYIDFVTAREIFNGTGDGQFAPDSSMTRAMFAMALANLDGADLTSYKDSHFSDVPAGQWYTAAIEWAADKGIVGGVGGDRYDPNAEITREQMAVMLSNFIDYKGYELDAVTEVNVFGDYGEISSWAEDAILKIQQAGIISGKPRNIFDPKGTATRAEVATIFARFIEALMG